VEDGTVDVRSCPFRRRAILRARVAGGSEQDRPVGTSEHTDRASDLLRRERASVVVRNRSGLASAEREREWCRKDKTQTQRRDNNMRLRCEKKGDPGCQSKETHATSMCLQYELIGNRLYSSLPIRQRQVTHLSSLLLIGL
jgi:hypothetical protein